jgi:hypothetical protein
VNVERLCLLSWRENLEKRGDTNNILIWERTEKTKYYGRMTKLIPPNPKVALPQHSCGHTGNLTFVELWGVFLHR